MLDYSLIENQQLKGFAFEILTLLNIEWIKEQLGRNGFYSKEYAWRGKNSQIDLIIDYGKEKFSLIEAKFYQNIFEINEKETTDIIRKKEDFLNSINKINKEMDVILFTIMGTKNKDGRIQYIDICLKDMIE